MTYLETLEDAWRLHKKRRTATAPTVISTFAGCGGSSLGYSMAGFRELMAVEWDAPAAATFRANFKGVSLFEGDIADISVERCLAEAKLQPGELDVFDGSPPCQGFSTAGKREMNDGRNQLFLEFVRLLRGLQPRVFVMENVSGMVKGKMRLVFADIMKELKASGYQVRARLQNAMYFGVPQSRQRLIFIGVRNDLDLEPSHPDPVSAPVSVWHAIGHLGNVQDPAIGHVWIDESSSGIGTKSFAGAMQAKQGQLYAGQKRRASWHKPADTITTGGVACGKRIYLRGLTCHPKYTRTYSLLETRLLSSFPIDFTFVGTIGQAQRQLGNCVPPLFMKSIAEHIRSELLGSGGS